MGSALDQDNNVMTHDAQPEAAEGVIMFASQKDLAAATAGWPTSRYIGLWNSFAGTAGPFAKLKEIRKFTDRATAVQRIWNVLHILSGDPAQDIKDLQAYADGKKAAKDAPAEATAPARPRRPRRTRPRARKRLRKPNLARLPRSQPTLPAPRARAARRPQVVAMLQRKGGATLAGDHGLRFTLHLARMMRGILVYLALPW